MIYGHGQTSTKERTPPMKKLTKLTTALGLALMITLTGCHVKIRGEWNPEHPGEFRASTELHEGELYRILNHTPETITVMLLDDRTPLDYFPLLPGESQDFAAPGDSFDLLTAGEQTLRGLSLWWIPN